MRWTHLSLKGRSVLTLPPDIFRCLSAFAPALSRRAWQRALVQMPGAILANAWSAPSCTSWGRIRNPE